VGGDHRLVTAFALELSSAQRAQVLIALWPPTLAECSTRMASELRELLEQASSAKPLIRGKPISDIVVIFPTVMRKNLSR
jgi:hypothetical protein